MDNVIWGIDFTTRKQAERASVGVAQIALEGGPTIEIPMSDVEAWETEQHPLVRVEPPADCPA